MFHIQDVTTNHNKNSNNREYGLIVPELPAAIPFRERPSIDEIAQLLVLSYAATEPVRRMQK